MPVAVLEGNEPRTTYASNRLSTRRASLSKQLSKAVRAVRTLVPRREPLSRQRQVAVGAGEALAVPGLVLVCDATLVDDLVTLHTACSKLVLVAASAVDLLLARDEALGANRVLADHATETLLMPLPCFVLHFLGSSTEHLSAAIAAARELRVIAVAAVDLVELGPKLLVHERHATLGADEARLVPVFVLVG